MFLIYFALRIKPITRDLKLIIAVAAAEYFVPIVVLIDYIYYSVTKQRLIHITLGCQILGFLINAVYYFEVQLNVFLAAERLCKVLKIKLPKYIFLPLHINAISFILLILYCATQNLMAPASSDLICMLSVTDSIIGSITYHYLVLSFFIGVLIVSFCYYKLARNITYMKDFIQIEISSVPTSGKDNRISSLNSATIRLYIILVVYVVCMSGSVLFHLLESSLHYSWGELNQTIVIINQVGQILFVIGILANSSLLLILHTGIAKEVKMFYKSIKCW
ncbi:hypothetical protein K502DRAFT_346706 [Neoconidiobolus thromboides FSU 785]|nr:hypothetical protein K502DRAFT_346706 [Neoconidiobolus thromboides FSU 785]